VFYEEVVEEIAQINDEVSDDDFVIIDSKDALHDMVVVDPVTVAYERLKEEQMAMSFDMPLAETQEDDVEEEQDNVITFSLDDDVKDIEVKNPVEVITVLEYNKKGETRYSLDDYMDLENKLTNAKPKTTQNKPEVVEKEMQIEKKPIAQTNVSEEKTVAETGKPEETTVRAVDPMDSPIDAMLKERADERRRKLKDFNYKFQNSVSSIDEIEREPAYKRQGIDLSANPRQESKVSRTTLGEDSNDEIQLRSNNSFLHDNVD